LLVIIVIVAPFVVLAFVVRKNLRSGNPK
jgi:hypothetical protein